MIVQWNELLWFHFATVDDDFSSKDLQALERRLITAVSAALLQGRCRVRHEAEFGRIQMISNAATESIVLPALRGVMGNWVYYCCLMDFGDAR